VSAEPSVTRMVLVRHGESRCNIEGVVGGDRGCTGLTERGVAQVATLAARLVATGELAGTAALYASTLPRAIETAEILRPALEAGRGAALPVQIERALREIDPGEADTMAWPDVYIRWGPFNLDDDSEPWVPGGEAWRDFTARVAGAVTRLADDHPGQLVVIACHGGVIGGTMARFLPIDPGAARLDLAAKYASMTEWERRDGRWMLQRYNDGGEPSAPIAMA
jgi:2,3-bisphosphoglycerate-dependent phosphoglycerate mutase